MTKEKNLSPEAYYQKKNSRNIIIALEELNFFWDEDDVNEVAEMCRLGIPKEMIASNFDRDIDEVEVLIIHLKRKNRLRPRNGGEGGR